MAELEGEHLLSSKTAVLPQHSRPRSLQSLWQAFCCRCRCRRPITVSSKAPSLGILDRSYRVPAHTQVLPDFVVRMSAPYLHSVGIARLFSVDRSCCQALSLPGLVNEVALLRGMEENRLASLAQLHLEEELPLGSNVMNFEFMSSELDRATKDTLNRVAKLLHKHPSSQVFIEAHAQPGAPPDIAKSISRERATAVANALQRRNVDEKRLHMDGCGTTRRLLSGNDRAHRRAEIFITLDGAQFPGDRLPFTEDHSSERFARMQAFSVTRMPRASLTDDSD